MAYTLFFRAVGAPPSVEELLAHFAGRPGWDAGGHRAQYEPDRRGAVFGFDLDEGVGPDGELRVAFEAEDDRRPGFEREAELEVRAFVERFGLEVDDPQPGGMGQGPYSTEGFLRGWRGAGPPA